MIKANELRIGNWVNTEHGLGKVCSIYANKKNEFAIGVVVKPMIRYEYLNPTITPILITPEILEKAGFLKEDWSYIFPFNSGNTAYSIEQYGSRFGFCYSGQVTKETWIEYLHQLQNLYFSLTGQELKIDL